jgi:branched-chain amino acid transport system ATP-binding protein
MLEVRNLSRSFGALRVTNDVSLKLERGARHALIGPNGAGKTTLINLLTGALAPSSGQILLDGAPVTGLGMHERAKLGIVRTFQINTLFPDFTPLLAVTLAVCVSTGRAHRAWSSLARETAAIDAAWAILAQVRLEDCADVPTRTLAYGKQRLLEVALALAARPRVLLLDEPAAGIPQGESGELFATLARLPDDLAILLIEHDMKLVFQFASEISVLVQGTLLKSGTPQQIAQDEDVRRVYLGGAHAAAA